MTELESELLKEIEEEKKLKPSDIEAELQSEIESQQKPLEESKTTSAGMIGAVTRGLAPTAAQVGAGALTGFAVGGPPGAVVGAAAGPVVGQLADLTVSGINSYFGTDFATTKGAVTHLLDSLGTPKPDTAAEKITEAVSEGLGAGAGISKSFQALEKLGATVPETLMAPKQQALQKAFRELGSGVGTQAAVGGLSFGAAEAAKQAGASPLGQTGAALAGTLLPIAARSVIPTAGQRTITEEAARAVMGKRSAEKAIAEAAAAEAQIGGRKVSDVAKELGFAKEEVPQEFLSASPEFQALIKKGAASAESLLAKRQNEFLTSVSDKARQIAQKAGSTEDLSILSNDIKDTILKESKKYQADEQALFAELSKKPVIRTIHKPQNTLQEVETLLIDTGVPQSTLDKIKLGQKLSPEELNEFTPKFESLSPVTKNIFKTLYKDPNPTINTINQVRKKLGDWLAGEKGEFSNATRGEVKRYYGLLSDDYDTALSAFPELEATRKTAFELTKARKTQEENLVNLFGKELSDSISGKISGAVGAAAKGDANKIKNILESVPEDYKANVIATGIQNATSTGGVFDVQKFTQWYNSLKGQKASYNALFDQLPPDSKKEFDNLSTLSQSIENATKQTTKVGDINQQIKANQTVGITLASILKGSIAGAAIYNISKTFNIYPELAFIFANAVTGGIVAKSIGKGQRQALLSLDELLASGDFARLVAKSKGNAERFNRTIPEFMNEPAYKKFAKQVGPQTAKNLLYTSGAYLQAAQVPEEELPQQ